MKKGLWKEDSDIIGLPKTKIVRVKAKKKVKAEEGAATGEAAGTTGAAAVPKPAEGAKPAAKPGAGAAKK